MMFEMGIKVSRETMANAYEALEISKYSGEVGKCTNWQVYARCSLRACVLLAVPNNSGARRVAILHPDWSTYYRQQCIVAIACYN